jgi:hypothetical protein
MIESLLCLLDVFTGLHFGPVPSRHCGVPGLELETAAESPSLLLDSLDPLDGFESFLQVSAFDDPFPGTNFTTYVKVNMSIQFRMLFWGCTLSG